MKIFGKDYTPVNERVIEAHKDNKDTLTITTEFLPVEGIVCKATVVTKKGTFTGTSAANPKKSIEAMSPYEVAETSAVGRALGFAGYGIVESIATADEIAKTTVEVTEEIVWKCPLCKATKTPSGKVFHSPKCTNQEGRV